MCRRFSIISSISELARRFDGQQLPLHAAHSYNIALTQQVLTVSRWNLTLAQSATSAASTAADIAGRIFNFAIVSGSTIAATSQPQGCSKAKKPDHMVREAQVAQQPLVQGLIRRNAAGHRPRQHHPCSYRHHHHPERQLGGLSILAMTMVRQSC